MFLQRRILFHGALFAALLPIPSVALAQTDATVTPLTPAQLKAKLDPQLAVVLDLYGKIAGTPLTSLSPQDARQQFAAQDAAKIVARMTGKEPSARPVGKVVDGMTIPGSDGNEIPIRVYQPQTSGTHPVVLYFHGGGFVIATIDTYDESARALCDFADAVVVSVEYRKSPEHPFPAAYNDAVSSYKWLLSHASEVGGNGKVAIAGESAGGNLAAEVTLAARDEHLQMPTMELLVYPETTSDLNQSSDILYKDAIPLNTAALYYFDGLYRPASDANLPTIAPLNADLKGLPPTTIIAAEEDPLRSDGFAYANKLRKVGDTVAYALVPGTTHEFFGMGAVVDKALQAEQYAGAQLKASFGTK